MNTNIKRRVCFLLAAVLTVALIAPAVLADNGEVHIKTADDLRDFSKKCQLDTFSEGLEVYLDADIDLAGEAFFPIPTFSGIFNGQGHSVSGFKLGTDGSHQGFSDLYRKAPKSSV